MSDRAPVQPAGTQTLFVELYAELRRLAHGRLRHERPQHTLSATALTHEAYLRLDGQNKPWENREQFMAIAATMMRRVLVDHALARQADKRSAELVTLSAAELEAATEAAPVEVLDLHRALEQLEQQDVRAARVVELRYFGGLELEEIAAVMDISLATVKRDWTLARSWLKSRLGSGSG
ncbi:ECF-type sigma factor [Pelomonas sp. SE-A7]|uniref:ECF-type sigma factor n=1 Tax=Pelomonas sp. SE-A7 TaxID=3054953 RepID=UPI00259CF5EB|nr:ECF-type sigma factor [Pelomonas sp. SE-A7]MDM4767638.1 ECF-type sigma factor [Pelomonas sp. SE-A7]